ncbi:MAG: SET domain-containing protein-lysine N-methyltransferase [Chitinophagaceae bacterium]|nr:SET domain-containing protein-lysine N-methyltransferase [Chitinophagaceae bacterium]
MTFSPFNNNRSSIIRQPAGLYLSASPIHGLGVFSKFSIPKSTLIETAPFIAGSAADYAMLSQTILHDYYFMVADKKAPVAIGLGFSSWYNHCCPANAVYSIHKKKMIIEIKAVRNIEAGEEITINYHGAFNNTTAIEF